MCANKLRVAVLCTSTAGLMDGLWERKGAESGKQNTTPAGVMKAFCLIVLLSWISSSLSGLTLLPGSLQNVVYIWQPLKDQCISFYQIQRPGLHFVEKNSIRSICVFICLFFDLYFVESFKFKGFVSMNTSWILSSKHLMLKVPCLLCDSGNSA